MARMALVVAMEVPEGATREQVADFVYAAIKGAKRAAKTPLAKLDPKAHRLQVRYSTTNKTRAVLAENV